MIMKEGMVCRTGSFPLFHFKILCAVDDLRDSTAEQGGAFDEC
ncbi:hypothetical protein HM1_2273 [Heliomicrobium modesticaldum Ice1]|uniref:Uncharacterized protein n=1 Tax=Heliobacterium modesticaldum (strain ATCC 51547 / Ice1) TaxID=498761 RepID=B0THP6_HELMI|nr:hypothetical protein HM1_2273 [Heliomicrobium modesticaldum Ice1]